MNELDNYNCCPRYLLCDLDLLKTMEPIEPFRFESVRITYAKIEEAFEEQLRMQRQEEADLIARLGNMFLD